MKELWESVLRETSSLFKKFFPASADAHPSASPDSRADTLSPGLSRTGEIASPSGDTADAIDSSRSDSSGLPEDSDLRRVDFSAPQDSAGTTPIYCAIGNEEIHLPQKSWAVLVVTFIEKLLAEKHPGLDRLYEPLPNEKRAFFMPDPLEKPRQYKLSNGCWINLYCNVPSHVQILKRLCLCCDIPLDSVVIGCKAHDGNSGRTLSVEQEHQKEHGYPEKDRREAISEALREELASYEQKRNASSFQPDSAPRETAGPSDISEGAGGSIEASVPENETVSLPPPDKPVVSYPSAILLDFKYTTNIYFTKPVACYLRGEELVLEKETWACLFLTVVERLIKENHPKIKSLHYTRLTGRQPFFLPEKSDAQCRLLSNGKWLNVKYSSISIVRLIKLLFKQCGLNINDIQIWYASIHEAAQSIKPQLPATTVSRCPQGQILDFSKLKTVEHSEPIACYLRGVSLPLEKNTWTQVLIALTEELIEEEHPALESLSDNPLMGNNTFFLPEKKLPGHVRLSNGKWLNVSYNDRRIVRLIKRLCRHCWIPLKEFQIYYQPKKIKKILPETDGTGHISTSNLTLFNFDKPGLATYTHPVRFEISGKEIPLSDHSWEQVFVAFMEHLIQENHPGLEQVPLRAKGRLFHTQKTAIHQNCLSNGKWLAVDYNPVGIIIRIRRLCHYLDINLKELKIWYSASMPIQSQVPIVADTPVTYQADSSEIQLLDFNNPNSVTRTRPVDLHVFGEKIPLLKDSWAHVLVALTEYLIERNYPELKTLEQTPLRGKDLLFESRRTKRHRHCLSNGKWLHLHNSAIGMVIMVRKLCEFCSIPLENIKVQYLHNGQQESSVSKKQPLSSSLDAPPKVELSPELKDAICRVLRTGFGGGFLTGSPVECCRFRMTAEKLGVLTLPKDNDTLDAAIASCGISYENKVYLIAEEAKSRLLELLNQTRKENIDLIYYAKFYEVHEDWLTSSGIFRAGILKRVMQELPLPQETVFKKKYLLLQGNDSAETPALRREILRIWKEEDVTLSYDEIARRLPYIPMKKIKNSLAFYPEFIWNTTKEYTHLSRFIILEETKAELRKAAEDECRRNSFVSSQELPLKKLLEDNYKFSQSAVEEAAFQAALSEDFQRRGAIITTKGTALNINLLLRERCSSSPHCSFKELVDYHIELTGKMRHASILAIVHSVKIRIDDDTFVSEDRISFDVKKVDSVLDKLVKGEFIPLKDVMSFALFPACGSPWNLFLLESYCYRFSQQFRYDVLALNSSNAGAVIRKSCSLSYKEVLAQALAESGVPLEKKASLNYLFDRGYLGKRSYKTIDLLLKEARQLREKTI